MSDQTSMLYSLSQKWDYTLDDLRELYAKDEIEKQDKVKILAFVLNQRIELGDLELDPSEISVYIKQTCLDQRIPIAERTIEEALPPQYKRKYGDETAESADLDSSDQTVNKEWQGVDKDNNILDFEAFTASCKVIHEHWLKDKDDKQILDKDGKPIWCSFSWYDVPDYTLMKELDNVTKTTIAKLEDNPEHYAVEELTEPEKDELMTFFDMLTTLKQQLDDRFDILTKDTWKYLYALGISSIRTISDKYHVFIKVTHNLSTKQISKYLKGKSRHSPINPESIEQAMRWGYTGKPCPECGSLKYEEKVNSLSEPITSFYRCFSCGHAPDVALPVSKEIIYGSSITDT